MTNIYKDMQARRCQDEQGERLVAEFLDLFFYSKLGISERHRDTAHQVSGVDLTLYSTLTGEVYLIDEKSSVQYWGKSLNTFALSLSNIDRSGCERLGWFLDDKLLNTHYVFIWITKGDYQLETIEQADIALVSKEAIWNYLASRGWNAKKLLLKNKLIRDAFENYGDDYWKHINLGNLEEDGVKFSLLTKFWERDCNLLIPKDVLLEISDYKVHFDILDELAKK